MRKVDSYPENEILDWSFVDDVQRSISKRSPRAIEAVWRSYLIIKAFIVLGADHENSRKNFSDFTSAGNKKQDRFLSILTSFFFLLLSRHASGPTSTLLQYSVKIENYSNSTG